MVARPPNLHARALTKVLVDVTRTAAALWVEQDADSPRFGIAWIPAQRILADQPLGEQEVDVGPGLPGGQIFALRVNQVQRDHAVSCRMPPLHDQVGRELVHLGGRCDDRGFLSGSHPSELLSVVTSSVSSASSRRKSFIKSQASGNV